MTTIRLATFFGRILFGSLWSSLLVIPSLMLIMSRADDITLASLGFWIAIAGIASGNFVFMYVVADRLCRVRERWAVDMAELALLVCFGLAIVMTLTLWIAGGAL